MIRSTRIIEVLLRRYSHIILHWAPRHKILIASKVALENSLTLESCKYCTGQRKGDRSYVRFLVLNGRLGIQYTISIAVGPLKL